MLLSIYLVAIHMKRKPYKWLLWLCYCSCTWFFLKILVLFIYWHSNGWEMGKEESVFFLLFSFENVCRNKKSFYICTRNTEVVHDLLEKWQSGRMRQSWKLLTVTGPGVRIPLSPPAGKQIELKPLKSYDFKGFFFLSHIKLFIHSWT